MNHKTETKREGYCSFEPELQCFQFVHNLERSLLDEF